MKFRSVQGAVYGFALVTIVAAGLDALNVELTAALLLLLAAVCVCGAIGVAALVAGTATALIALDLRFMEPTGTLRVERGHDIVALVVFGITAALLGWLVNSMVKLAGELRRDEVEARLRFGLATVFVQGDDVEAAMRDTVSTLRDVFDLQRCVLRIGDVVVEVGEDRAQPDFTFASGTVQVDARANDYLDDRERTHLEALVVQIATAVDRLRLQDEVRDARMLAEVRRQRATFLSAISHNLRTPLTAIKAASGTLRASWSRIEPEERRELLDTISDEAERLERLVRNTLELSRIRAGALEFAPQPVDIADLVQHAVRRLRPISRAHRVRLDVGEDLPAIELDVTMIEQILLNLLENALSYAPPGSEILVGAHLTADDRAIEVRVSDHGPGVPVEARERVFEELQSAETRIDQSGTGLGLAIVRSLAMAHGGSARYEETPGGGATFVCTFPLQRNGSPLGSTREGDVT